MRLKKPFFFKRILKHRFAKLLSTSYYNLRTMSLKILIFIGVIIAMTSCDEKEKFDLNGIDSYPISVGNYWDYNRELVFKKYESETSDKVIDIDTFNFSIKVSITKDTILNDTMSVKQFVATEAGRDFSSYQYMYIDSEGLKCYAYSNAGTFVFAKKGMQINALSDLSYLGIEIGNSIDNSNIFFENPPTLNLKLPLENDSKWTYRQPNESLGLQIDKEVVGIETIKVNGRSFLCYKINLEYLNTTIFNEIQMTDWISKEGLIKRQTIFGRTSLIPAEGDPIIEGNIQLTETLTLKELNIN